MTDTPHPQNVLEDWMGRKELASELSISVDTLARWEAQRIGPPCVKIGRRVYYRREAVRDWLVSKERPNIRGRKA